MKFIEYLIHCARLYYWRGVERKLTQADSLVIMAMRKLSQPELCQATGIPAHYLYSIRILKKDRLRKAEYRIGAYVLARLLVDKPVTQVAFHPECVSDEEPTSPQAYHMLKQAMLARRRRIDARVEYLEC